MGKGRRVHILAAWSSLFAGLVIALVIWLWTVNHVGKRGERDPAVLFLYVILLLASGAGSLAGVFRASNRMIRSDI
jgi:hypothetical protein